MTFHSVIIPDSFPVGRSDAGQFVIRKSNSTIGTESAARGAGGGDEGGRRMKRNEKTNVIGSNGSPDPRFSPTTCPSPASSCRPTIVSNTSSPAFAARVLGMTNNASAKASTPSFVLPFDFEAICETRCACAAISKAPAPGTREASSRVFLIERSPSRIASEICEMVWAFGPACIPRQCSYDDASTRIERREAGEYEMKNEPLTSRVHDLASLTSSTKVYFSSPSVCS